MPALQDALRALCREFIDIFDTAVRSTPAKVDAMVIEIDRSKLELPQNRLPQRNHSAEKQRAICTLRQAQCRLEGWPIPNMQQTLSRIGTLKPTVFALLDFTKFAKGIHSIQCCGRFVPVDQSSHGIERSLFLLSTQHVEHSPCRLSVPHLRTVH